MQAADSLSFLETMVPLIVDWVESGRAPRERAAGKLEHSVERISPDLPRAREIGRALLAPALSRVRAANAPDEVRGLLRLVRTGRMHRLARDRFPRMPLWPGHPAFEVISYRTPQGIRAAGDQPWGAPNDACLGFMSELVMGTVHSGAHIDAHAHMTIDGRWHGGTAGDGSRRLRAAEGRRHRDPAAVAPGRPLRRARPSRRGLAPGGRAGDRRRAAGHRVRRRGRRRGRRGARPHRLPRALARSRRPRRPSRRRAGHQRRAAARRARRARRRLGHRDLRGPAGARPRHARQPAAGPHAAADRARDLHPRDRSTSRPLRARACASSCSSPCRWPSAGRRARWSTRWRCHEGAGRRRAERLLRARGGAARAGPARGAVPCAGDRHLRHRPAHHPGPLPGLLAAGLAADPRARVVRRGGRARAGRGRLRLGDRHARGGHLARRLRVLPQVRRGPVQPLRAVRRPARPQAVRAQRRRRLRRVRRPLDQERVPGSGRALRRGGGDARPGGHRAAHGQARRPRAGRHGGGGRAGRDGPAGRRVRAGDRRGARDRGRSRCAAGEGARRWASRPSTSRPATPSRRCGR